MTRTRSTGPLLAAGLLAITAPLAAQRGPAPGVTHLPPEVLAAACAPTIAYEMPPAPLRITGGQDAFARQIFSPGDLVTINAGTQNGIDVGQEFFVRRAQVSREEAITRANPASIRTTGWIRVYAVDDMMSLATITHACDTIEVDDYLEPLVLRPLPTASLQRPKAERDNYARVLVGVDRRSSFGAGDFFMIDRGSDGGITSGMNLVLYRDKRLADNFLYELGEAVAIDVKADSSTVQVTVARDAIQEGDYVAMRR
jgi:hypothetical protein